MFLLEAFPYNETTVQVDPLLDLARSMFTVTLSVERLRQQFPYLSQSEVPLLS